MVWDRVEHQDLAMGLEVVVSRFGLGRLEAKPVRMAGGLSNELWQVRTSSGVFAVKRMVVNAERPDFIGNVEGAFRVELGAWNAGVATPEPIAEPGSGRALVRVDGELFRVHRWVDGRAADSAAAQAAELLADIHAAGAPRWEEFADHGWDGGRWGAEIASLADRVRSAPLQMLTVDSHRDLDRKNALRRGDGTLLALDWDAAGPVGAVQEAVAVALDWAATEAGDPSPHGEDDRQRGASGVPHARADSGVRPGKEAPGKEAPGKEAPDVSAAGQNGDRRVSDRTDAFADAVAAYCRRSGVAVPAEPWVFGGWVAALGGWLDYNADHRADEEIGRTEIAATRRRLRALADNMDAWLDALGRV
ncbi:hypothetical protein OWR29_38690 [Actinoplanes sp. Pm04-4]|uniref:Aminoglycoside phosphotransferase domain-containing protein n=1 Tax=Paractinoplanes pyxinae TaxID=2997416 RepID=A0ABT4BBR3_9ACTN|nr:hypothetical protein [Actinoplanes pyxinae]MCY1143959.1 hypothetical protein [Actinoplanes pyxinae]